MNRASPTALPLLLLANMIACNQSAATGENTAAPKTIRGERATAAANENIATAADRSRSAKAAAATITPLPLKRGYYVASDIPCSEASNATVALLRRQGLGGARDFCAFIAMERSGPDTYRVTQACRDLQDSAPPATSVVTYTLLSDTRFTANSEHGWEHSARYCDQSRMPPEWRENDISDVTD